MSKKEACRRAIARGIRPAKLKKGAEYLVTESAIFNKFVGQP